MGELSRNIVADASALTENSQDFTSSSLCRTRSITEDAFFNAAAYTTGDPVSSRRSALFVSIVASLDDRFNNSASSSSYYPPRSPRPKKPARPSEPSTPCRHAREKLRQRFPHRESVFGPKHGESAEWSYSDSSVSRQSAITLHNTILLYAFFLALVLVHQQYLALRYPRGKKKLIE